MFLTVIPLRIGDDEATDDDLAASRYAYPVVGAAIGLALAALGAGLGRWGFPLPLSAFLILAAWVAVSGGLHLDGLADTFDGLFLWGDAARRLAVMRDPHVGSFGVSALVLVLLGKYAVLSQLPGRGRALVVLGAAAVGRTLLLVSAGSAPYARPEGTGRVVIDAASPRDAIGATALALAIGAGLFGLAGLRAGVLSVLLAWGLTRLSYHKLGGVTGDILGAVVELGELTFVAALGSSELLP